MLQLICPSLLIKVLSGELFVNARDCYEFKLDGAADGLKEPILEIALVMGPECSAAGVLPCLRETPVIYDVSMVNVH